MFVLIKMKLINILKKTCQLKLKLLIRNKKVRDQVDLVELNLSEESDNGNKEIGLSVKKKLKQIMKLKILSI